MVPFMGFRIVGNVGRSRPVTRFPEVKRGLMLRLRKLCETEEAAEIVFRALFRLSRDEPGRSKYPKFSWDYLRYYLDHHEDE